MNAVGLPRDKTRAILEAIRATPAAMIPNLTNQQAKPAKILGIICKVTLSNILVGPGDPVGLGVGVGLGVEDGVGVGVTESVGVGVVINGQFKVTEEPSNKLFGAEEFVFIP